jgi:hypothetical protein
VAKCAGGLEVETPEDKPRLAQTRISCLWNQPDAASNYRAAVSLHSHTNRSKESLGFIQEFAQRWPLLNWALERQYKRSRVPVDLTRAYWTPPLTPKLAFEAEKNQIEDVLGLQGLVALTDHDNIEAPTLLRMVEETRQIPYALEWAVPFGDAVFHLGVHNLPSHRAQEIVVELAAYTQDPSSRILPELIGMLDQLPEVLVIFNHPLWDLRGLGKQRFLPALEQFLQENVAFLHAFEFNATRGWKENHAVLQLADRWQRLIVSGGDRHGCEPSGALNLTCARSFCEFIYEIRREQHSHVLLMPQYAESLCMRTTQTLLDVIRDYPEYAAGSQRWDDRVFHPDLAAGDNIDRPVSSYWKGPPAFLRRIFYGIRLLENPAVRGVLARVLPGKADLELGSDVLEVSPEIAYEATV